MSEPERLAALLIELRRILDDGPTDEEMHTYRLNASDAVNRDANWYEWTAHAILAAIDAAGVRVPANPEPPYLYHGDGDLCLGPECLSIDEATGNHDTELHSDEWWEGFTEHSRRTVPAPEPLDVERLRAVRVLAEDWVEAERLLDLMTVDDGAALEDALDGVHETRAALARAYAEQPTTEETP